MAVPHPAQNARVVALDFHASATAKALLPPPEFAIDRGLGDRNAGGQT